MCYDYYWRFAFARQSRFFARKTSTACYEPDTILDQYKFTNCYRALDRASQYLIKNITNRNDLSKSDTFFRIILFKLFNKIETWEALERKVDGIKLSNFNLAHYATALEEIKAEAHSIYSAAYIMPSGMQYGSPLKHVNNLRMLAKFIDNGTSDRIWDTESLERTYHVFLDTPSLGKFLAMQLSVDCAYSRYSSNKEDQFVVAGPGAERGISKCFPHAKPTDYVNIIKHMQNIQEEEFQRLRLDFNYLDNRRLQLIDCQNIFCELDKYLRVKHPEFNRGTKRIKQHYKPNLLAIEYELPKKWNSQI